MLFRKGYAGSPLLHRHPTVLPPADGVAVTLTVTRSVQECVGSATVQMKDRNQYRIVPLCRSFIRAWSKLLHSCVTSTWCPGSKPGKRDIQASSAYFTEVDFRTAVVQKSRSPHANDKIKKAEERGDACTKFPPNTML